MSDAVPLEELASLPSFHHPAASPTGEYVAVYYDVTGRNELHLIDVETGEMSQLSDGDVPRNARWPFRWAPDGETIYFHADDAGDEQNDVFAISLEGDVEPVIEREGQTILQDVSEDGRWLLFGNDGGDQMNLYRYDRHEGVVEQLTEYDKPAGGGSFSPDGERIAYTANETDDLENADVYVMDADGSNRRNLEIGDVGAEAAAADWSPDGSALLIGDNSEDRNRVGIYDLESGDLEWVSSGEYVESPVGFLPEGDELLVRRFRNAAVVPVVYGRSDGSSGRSAGDASGDGWTTREFDLPEGVANVPGHGTVVGDEREVIVTQETPTQRPTLLHYEVESGESTALLEPEYGDIDPDSFVEGEYFRFASHDGREIGAILYDSGERPSPAVVNPHGGPASLDLLDFGYRTQYLLAQGYSVLQVNYRGSVGRGREFKNLLIEDWGGGEQDDIAAGTRWLADREWIDEDRIAVFGGSYGGYSAYWQLVAYPELYAAGVAWIGVTDLEAMYDESMPHYRVGLLEKYLGTPEENPDLYRERSPVTHAENLEAPLLMVHGVNDSRVPLSQAEIFRDRLEELGYEEGQDYEYEELGAEGHGSTDVDQKIRSLRLVGEFLERRL
ncbi:S9 family peptidase [Natrononativus amylolyticus]|uniref:S9 family peptidase n=1 Tax=Natrononativus amylolyticus TaxID=2963434 RepID=UPI0020CDA52E|nr:S9 family peptidase [Natrononativus amylolyticus]